jgi:dihydrofolate synthase/folylpolyglutamate synthase
VEILGRNPTIVMDVAHNVASIQALVDVLAQQFPGTKPNLMFATSRDKDVAGMLRVLLPACEKLILTKYVTNPRALEISELDAISQEVASQFPNAALPKILVAPTPASAWECACQTHRGLICITGSFFLAADMKEVLRNTNRDIRSEM